MRPMSDGMLHRQLLTLFTGILYTPAFFGFHVFVIKFLYTEPVYTADIPEARLYPVDFDPGYNLT